MPDTTFARGTVITKHSRLWRVDAYEGVVPVATPIDGGEAVKSYVHLEDNQRSRLQPPLPEIGASPAISISSLSKAPGQFIWELCSYQIGRCTAFPPTLEPANPP